MRITFKLGGSILDDAAVRARILGQIATAARGGHDVILVHGGGKHLSRRLAQLGMSAHFIDGLRVTDAATLEVAVMVLAGEVNKMLVAEMCLLGCPCVGICGADGWTVRCTPLCGDVDPDKDLGFVGKPSEVTKSLIESLLKSGMVPVISSIALGEDCLLYNVNADQMASACAWGAGSSALVYLTDVAGVLDQNRRLISRLSKGEVEQLRQTGVLTGGMLPKTSASLEALNRGVRSVFILPGAAPGIIDRFLEGNLTEGTFIHDDD